MVDDTAIRDILAGIKTIAVVGCSKDPAKDAHRVPKYMQMNGYRIIPVNPTATEILGEKAFRRSTPFQFRMTRSTSFAPRRMCRRLSSRPSPVPQG